MPESQLPCCDTVPQQRILLSRANKTSKKLFFKVNLKGALSDTNKSILAKKKSNNYMKQLLSGHQILFTLGKETSFISNSLLSINR